jgi:hypothetical protein
MSNVLRTFRSKPYVVIERDTLDVLGSSGNKAHASALGASKVGENGYRVINLSAIDGLEEAAANAQDLAGAYVAAFANGSDIDSIARHYQRSIDPRGVYDSKARKVVSLRDARHIVAEDIREAIGSLSRVKARRWCAEQILQGATG